MAFEGQLDPPVSGTDRAILLTSGVSTKAEWVMGRPKFEKKKLREGHDPKTDRRDHGVVVIETKYCYSPSHMEIKRKEKES